MNTDTPRQLALVNVTPGAVSALALDGMPSVYHRVETTIIALDFPDGPTEAMDAHPRALVTHVARLVPSKKDPHTAGAEEVAGALESLSSDNFTFGSYPVAALVGAKKSRAKGTAAARSVWETLTEWTEGWNHGGLVNDTELSERAGVVQAHMALSRYLEEDQVSTRGARRILIGFGTPHHQSPPGIVSTLHTHLTTARSIAERSNKKAPLESLRWATY